MSSQRISSRIVLIAAVSTTICVAIFLLIDTAGNFGITPAFLLLSVFTSFVISFLSLYYFYFVDINRAMRRLNEKIRTRFLSTAIPQRADQLEEEDGFAVLDERVELLIELREKEVRHFENLDSYRKEYLGNVSHELKTPVFNIQGYIDTLLNGGLHDEKINEDYLRKAEKSVDRLITIIDDLETITQLESGVLELDLETFDIAQLCREIYSSLELQSAKKGVRLELARKYEKPVLVKADKFRIRQVLVNLVTNSIKYGKENGITTVSFSPLNDDVVIQVSDNGDGMEERHLSRVFERFYRVDKGRSREQGGTGLGLAIVKHIIEAHQKSIKVESQLNKGTRFTFSLAAAGQ